MPCITHVEFLPPTTPLGSGKICIKIKEEKECYSGGGSKLDASRITRCSLRIFIDLCSKEHLSSLVIIGQDLLHTITTRTPPPTW